uniref:Uncharacterized protein n=1 Tax=Megaselia scalaris TaxID=36166 RepID=T1GY12_MEGSC
MKDKRTGKKFGSPYAMSLKYKVSRFDFISERAVNNEDRTGINTMKQPEQFLEVSIFHPFKWTIYHPKHLPFKN